MSKRILILDDEQDMCDVIKEALEYHDHHVQITTLAEQALQMLDKNSFDIFLVDLRLRGSVSGIDVIRHCRQLPTRPKILVMTGTSSQATITLLSKEGVSDLVERILQKPVDITPRTIPGIIKEMI